jgi:integrase
VSTLALARHGLRLPSGVMIYNAKHHSAKAWPDLLAWLEYMKVANKRPRTLEAYERNAARLLMAYPEKRFDEFTDADLLAVLATAPDKSRHIYKAPLNQWFRWGYKTRRLKENPAEWLPDIRYKPNRNIDVFTQIERHALKALPYPDGELMTVLIETGIRNQEARELTVRRVDFDQEELLVREGAKGGKERLVDLTQAAAGAFHELILTDGLGPDDHFWASHPGGGHLTRRATPVPTSTFARWWRLSLEAAGVEYRKPHTTRHSFATFWLEAGIDEGYVQDWLGHESIRTTRDIYHHRNKGARREAMREIEQRIQSSHSSDAGTRS